MFLSTWFRKRVHKIKDLLMSGNGKFLPFEVSSRRFDVKACFTTNHGLCNSIRQNWNNISKEFRAVVDLTANWRSNSFNLATANLL